MINFNFLEQEEDDLYQIFAVSSCITCTVSSWKHEKRYKYLTLMGHKLSLLATHQNKWMITLVY